MPTPEERLKRFRERADECLAAAEKADNETLRVHYTHLAENYLRLIQTELALMSRDSDEA